MKITICGIGTFFKYLKICSFSGHGLFVNLNQYKIICRLRYKISNFEKPKFLVTRKLSQFWILLISRDWSKFSGGPRLKKVLNKCKYNFQSSKVCLENFLVISQGYLSQKDLVNHCHDFIKENTSSVRQIQFNKFS